MTSPALRHATAGGEPREADARLRALAAGLEACPLAYCVFGADRRPFALNKAMVALIGGPEAPSVGVGAGASGGAGGGGAAKALAALSAALSDPLERVLRLGCLATLDWPGRAGGAGERDRPALRLTLSPVEGERGGTEGVLCAATAIALPGEAEEALGLLFRHNPVPMWVHDRETMRFLAVNDAAVAAYGWSREAFLEMAVPDLRAGIQAPGEREAACATPAAPRRAVRICRNWRHVDALGGERIADILSRHFVFEGREAVLVAGWDVTDRARAEEALRESEELTRSVIESSTGCIKLLDLAGRVQFMNGPGEILMEVGEPALLLGREWAGLLPPEMAGEARRALDAARAGLAARFTGFCPTLRGAPRWWDVTVSPVRNAGGAVVRLLVVSHDISEKRNAEQRAAYLACHDPLTGLPNRRQFHAELKRLLAEPRDGRAMALHYLDLDHFKGINDALGHTAGDSLLQQVADRLRTLQPAGGGVFRLGGDEFALLQTRLAAPEEAAAMARRLVALLDEDYHLEGQLVAAGTSIGLALAPAHGDTPESLIKNADIALYHAKSGGRGTFRFFEPTMDEAVRRRQMLKAGLRSALKRGELSLHFQPLVDLRNGRVTCLETLLRWRHPLYGPVSPAEFIPLAEESGMIIRLGEWILRNACRAATCWPDTVNVAVNLSAVQFRDPGLLRALSETLCVTALRPGRLELEITESTLLQDDPANIATLDALRALGVRIALDDFGTGFSSLGYLLRIRFDKIKIDRSFIAGLPGRVESKAIVSAVVGMGHSLGLSVTAEGVETAEQLEALRQLGCTDAQGYLFSPPVPAAEVAALLWQPCSGPAQDMGEDPAG
ncbi:putative bifunctional diguanylate cyclase/phosphodiesterase [Teichococcus rhizosphaerae]|nr:EAL domain-containing protein [Pseudoroseomonas rhizosphaerae]